MEYRVGNCFVSRTPLLSIEDYGCVFNEDDSQHMASNLLNKFRDPFLLETLAVTSYELYEELLKVKNMESHHYSEHFLSTLIKYYIRLTTRPTPYGLFAGVSLGNFGDKTDMCITDAACHKKNARVDMEWLYSVVKKIESNTEIRKKLLVKSNNYTFVSGNRLEKPTRTFLQINGVSNEIGTSIRYTKQVQTVLEYANDLISYPDLLALIEKNNPTVPTEILELFLAQLLDNEFLITELRPPLFNVDPLTYVINILSKIKDCEEVEDYLNGLVIIKEKINSYNHTSIGEGLTLFDEIINIMKPLHESSNYLQVDMKVLTNNNELDISIKKELEDFMNAILSITPKNDFSDEYISYVDSFLEKYGVDAQVPILELLDANSGLGTPVYYQHDTAIYNTVKHPKSIQERRLEEIIKRKSIDAIKCDMHTIELTDEDIKYISNGRAGEIKKLQEYGKQVLPSFELFVLVHSYVPKEKKEKHFLSIAPAVASSGVGRSFGRFRYMFSSSETECLNKQFDDIKKSFPEDIMVEIAEIPEKGRLSNIAMNISDCNYQLMLSSNSCENKSIININDLYVAVEKRSRKLIIRSKQLNKNVILTSTNMLNPVLASNAVRFLKEISGKYAYDPTMTLLHIINQKGEYNPRITYKHIIIKPETWTISTKILNLDSFSENHFYFKFDEFKKKWDLPRYVFLTQHDNRLLLDLSNRNHQREIFYAMRKNPDVPIILSEKTCEDTEYVALDTTGKNYVTEVVVPFIFNQQSKEKTAKQIRPTIKSDVRLNAMNIHQKELVLFPYEKNWLYFKLYGYEKRKSELFALLYEKLEYYVQQGLINKYFFIRYADPKSHLRIRMQVKEKRYFQVVFENFIEEAKRYRTDGMISSVVLDTYQREVERYGGSTLINNAEEYFFYDSHFVLKFLSEYMVQENDRCCVGISVIVMSLYTFGLSMEEIEIFLDNRSNQHDFREEYRLNRKIFMAAADIKSNWSKMRQNNKYLQIYNDLVELKNHMGKYAREIWATDNKGMLTNYPIDIATALSHMFCNRLMGNNNWERKVYALARHSIRDLQAYQRYVS